MMKKNKRLFTPDAPGGPPRKKEGIRSWLKIQVESEGYQPPRGGAVLLQVLVGLLFFVFVVRFWYLQVHRGEEFARQAQENRLRQERIFAPRGRILDDGDKLLADNRTAYGLSLVREDCHDIPATLAQISAWSGIPLPQIWEKYQQDRFKVKSFEPLLMITDIDFDLVARIESEIYAWPGLEIVVRTKRSYPEKELFAHVLGYVAEANEQEMAKDPALAMGDLVGKQGLELELEKQLRPDNLHVTENISIVAAVGRKMAFRPGTSGRIFAALGEHGINIRMISQGPDELNIIVGVDTKDFVPAIQVLYNSFVK